MGLLDRAIAIQVNALIADFHRKNPMFHCVALKLERGGYERVLEAIGGMTSDYGAVCASLCGDHCLLLLPGGLDRELFAHRISHSTNSTVLCQTSASSAGPAFKALRPYLR